MMTSNELEQPPVYFPKFSEIFKMSKLENFEELFDQYIAISAKTSNSISEIEQMPFWKFKGISKALTKYLEKEAKQQGGTEGGENGVGDIQKNAKNMMNNAKANMPKVSKAKPKLK